MVGVCSSKSCKEYHDQRAWSNSPSICVWPIPSDLLDEPQAVAPATVSLHDHAIEQAQQIRTTARKAVLDLQDDRAMRRALMARPRVTRDFKPGDLVAYYRGQKWIEGQLNQQGRWYGTAIVLGYVGRNLVIAHRKHIFRCAPEQLRFATSEEKALLNTPQVDLLGIKDLIEGGTFKSQQFVDLTSGHYPTQGSHLAPASLESSEPGHEIARVSGRSCNSGIPNGGVDFF